VTGYDRWAPRYDDRDPSTSQDESFLLEQLKPFPGCRILDLGCGTGRYLRRLMPGWYRVTAVVSIIAWNSPLRVSCEIHPLPRL
jgi:SAM-dependent methyltransferase